MNDNMTPHQALDDISDLPDYMQKRALTRMQLIDEYHANFMSIDGNSSLSRRKSIALFCNRKRLHPDTFSRWLKNYEEMGIRGLTPAYGNRQGCSPYVDSVLPVVAEILKPGQSVAATYRELVTVCESRGIKPPSQKTLGRLLKMSGLTAKKERRQAITTVKASIDVDTQNPLVSLQQLADFIRSCPAIAHQVKERSKRHLNYLQNVVGRISPLALAKPLTADEIKILERYKGSQHKWHSAKATAILMANESASLFDLMSALCHHHTTIRSWIKLFNEIGVEFIEVKVDYPIRQQRIEERRTRIIDIIHTPPKAYDINRATWNYASIAEVYSLLYKQSISVKTVERVVKQSGYTWRRARKVLTSQDPEYRSKVEKILDTLQGLKEGETFFFIDEVGPYRVRKYGGVALRAKDAPDSEPGIQDLKSRGKVQFVAALEAVSNQLSWLFTVNKGSDSIIRLLEMLTMYYAGSSQMYLTWDATTVHSSKAVTAWIASHNGEGKCPRIEVVPLPSNSQFLNVIESVFGGMKKAVICNSDYATPAEMQGAIARHFEERNQFYRDNPKRAGNKIWDKQRFDIDKLAGGLFKRM